MVLQSRGRPQPERRVRFWERSGSGEALPDATISSQAMSVTSSEIG
jgi:hypothetical protein